MTRSLGERGSTLHGRAALLTLQGRADTLDGRAAVLCVRATLCGRAGALDVRAGALRRKADVLCGRAVGESAATLYWRAGVLGGLHGRQVPCVRGLVPYMRGMGRGLMLCVGITSSGSMLGDLFSLSVIFPALTAFLGLDLGS